MYVRMYKYIHTRTQTHLYSHMCEGPLQRSKDCGCDIEAQPIANCMMWILGPRLSLHALVEHEAVSSGRSSRLIVLSASAFSHVPKGSLQLI